jgi:hypothetical protein
LTTGEKLKQKLKLNNFSSVKIRRLITGSSVRIFQIVFDSRRPSMPLTTYRLNKNVLMPKVVDGSAEVYYGTPWASIENFNGNLDPAIFFVSDLSGFYGNKSNYSEKIVSYNGKRLEELTIPQIRDVEKYTSNTTQKYKDIRKINQGVGQINTKLLDSQYIKETGSLRFIFLTESTELKNKTDDKHKMTTKKVNVKKQFDVDADELIDNNSKTYDMFLQLENVFPNNYFQDLSWLEVYNGEVVSTKMMKDLLEVADVKLHDNTPAFQYQGFRYRLTQNDSSIFPEDRPDRVWRAKHGSQGLLDKHFSQLLDRGSIDFFLNQMTSMLIKHCKQLGYYKDKKIDI